MSKRPNIIFILIDDLGWRDLSCYGSKFYETPNIDRLFYEGMHFTDAYAAAPVCSPTRASILTGKYPARVGVTNYIGGPPARGILFDSPYVDHLPLSEKSLAVSLKETGYNTWHVGKWHLGGKEYHPENHGFDINIGGCHWGAPINGYFSPWGIDTLDDGPEGEYLTDRLTDEAIRLIKENDLNKPFFLNLWYYSVHVPIQAKESYIEKYIKKAQDMGLDKKKTFEVGEFFPAEALSPRIFRIFRRIIQSDPIYAAMIEILDENIGRLLKTIEETGQSDNTIIIFTSDNGGLSTAEGSPTTNYPLLEGKGWMYEGGVREPLIVKWPNVINPGSFCNVPVTSPDFYPTLLEAAELHPSSEQNLDGISFMPLLKEKNKLGRDSIYWHYPHYGNQGGTPGSSIRMGDYKLIEFFEDDRLELYNLKKDISEKDNIIKRYPDLAGKMKKKLAEWRKSVNGKIPEQNPDWNELE
jgi:arylsulfatase A-like enzyme